MNTETACPYAPPAMRAMEEEAVEVAVAVAIASVSAAASIAREDGPAALVALAVLVFLLVFAAVFFFLEVELGFAAFFLLFEEEEESTALGFLPEELFFRLGVLAMLGRETRENHSREVLLELSVCSDGLSEPESRPVHCRAGKGEHCYSRARVKY